MMSEESEGIAPAQAASGDVTLFGSDADLLGADKGQLIAKLEKAVEAEKFMKKQLDQQEQDSTKLQHRYQQQLEDKEGELMLAMSKIEAFQVELQSQQTDTLTIRELNDELQRMVDKATQEETRVMVFQEENHRLMNQVTATLEEKKQWELETQQLADENHTLQHKVKDLTQLLYSARKEREDVEQMYLEVASKLNQALRDCDELKKGRDAGLSRTDPNLQPNTLEAPTETCEQESLQLRQQIESLAASRDELAAELAEAVVIREKLLVHVGIDLTYESIESLLDTKNKEIQMLTEQLSAAEIPQEQAISEAVSVTVAEAEGLRSRFETLRAQYNALVINNNGQDKTVKDLYMELERFAREHETLQNAHRQMRMDKDQDIEQLAVKLDATEVLNQQVANDFIKIKSKIEELAEVLQIGRPTYAETNTELSRLDEVEAYLEHIKKQLVGSTKPLIVRLQSESITFQERIHKCEEEKQLLIVRLEECEAALKARASEFELFVARAATSGSDKSAHSPDNGASVGSLSVYTEDCTDLECNYDVMKAQLHAIHAQMTAYKAENLRMIFEIAKTADSASKIKQDYEELLKSHAKKTSKLDTTLVHLESLKCANQTLELELSRTSDELRCSLEAFAMQNEDFVSTTGKLDRALAEIEQENCKVKRDYKDIRSENDVLEERIGELLAFDYKTELDEGQEKDREVQELRSSLVQAKVNFLEQKQQLSALEKKLVQVSKLNPALAISSASLDTERREFEAALIEMIEMEKKLQVAYEAKQGLELTLQERMEAKTDLEGRLSIAEDKIAELEQQLEQKVSLISTIEEQLGQIEEERELLKEESAKFKSKLERSRGKLEEKAIEFETFKATTSMLKDERIRLFNEIAMLKDRIAKSEAQKVEIRDSQELENEELEEQLNELADKIAEIESEKQELCARLEETAYRSEQDIHQLRERLYMLEQEKMGLIEENRQLERKIEYLGNNLVSLEDQKANLEAANALNSQQLSLLAERFEKATGEVATLSAEKSGLIEVQQSLEERMSVLLEDKVKLEHTLDEMTAKLREEVRQITNHVEVLQGQLVQRSKEKEEIMASFLDLRKRSEDEKLASEKVIMDLKKQVAGNNTSENKIVVLKQMAEKALQSLQTNRDELAEAKTRADVLREERDALTLSLQEKQVVYDQLAFNWEKSKQQVEKLTGELEGWQKRHIEEAGKAEETFRALKETETRLTESLASVKRDLVEAESCVMTLVEERDVALKDVSTKDLRIAMMTTQQGELELANQKLESELKMLQTRNSADAEITDKIIRRFEESKTQAEHAFCNLTASYEQAQVSIKTLEEQLCKSKSHISVLENERDATRTFLNEKESTQETLSALQENLQKKVRILELELETLCEKSSAELRAANETIANLKTVQADEAHVLASELAEAEGCVVVLAEERDAAKKTLSKRELTLEILRIEHGELQLKHQSMTAELKTLTDRFAVNAEAAEATVYGLREELTHTIESLRAVQMELAGAEIRVSTLIAERDSATKTLSDLMTEHESLSSVKKELTEQMDSLKDGTTKLRNQHLAEIESSRETIRMLEQVDIETNESLELARLQLSEEMSRTVSLAAKLSEKETIVTKLTEQVEGSHKRIQSLESELEGLQHQRKKDTETLDETIRSLKASELQATDTLESVRQELADTEARLVSAEEEWEAISKTLSETESHRDAQSSEVLSLQERIQSLESELEGLQYQRKIDTETVEETICSLKASELQATNTLESVRQELANTEARLASAEEEREAISKTLSETESHRDAQSSEVLSLQERIQSLESELERLQYQRKIDTKTLDETIRSLKASELQATNTLESVRQELADTEARLASAEEEREAISKTLSETESHRDAQSSDVLSLQECIRSLKSELEGLQHQRKIDTETVEETIRSLKASKLQATNTLESVRHELADTEARLVSAEEERKAIGKTLSETESHRDAQSSEVLSLQERIQSLESELEGLQYQRKIDTETVEETIFSLKASELQATNTLESVRQELADTEARLASAEEEREAIGKALSETESHRDAQSSEVLSLQECIRSLESELEGLQHQRKIDTETVEETIRSLKASKKQATNTLESVRQELAVTEARLASAEEERKAIGKTLSETESHRDAQSSEVLSLQERIQSLESELEGLQHQRKIDTETLDETIRSLKASELQATNTLESVRQELADTEARLVSAEEEREAIGKALSETESHRDAQSSEVLSLQERIQSLESELEGLQYQRKIDTETVEETICSLKASELQVTNTLESVRQELADTEARLASAEEEREAISKTLSETESHRDAQSSEVLSLQERIQSLESELEGLQYQRKIDTETLDETIRSLKASELQATNTLESVRQELADTEARLASAEEEREAISKTLSETESHRDAQSSEVLSLQERIQSLESELEGLQYQRKIDTETLDETIRSLKASELQATNTLESVRQELADTEARLASAEEEREAISKTLSETESHRDAQSSEVLSLQERIQSLESELEGLQYQRKIDTETVEETICSLKASELQATNTLESVRQELADTEARLASAEEEREAISKTLSETESHHDAQSSEVSSLQERIQSLESELEGLQHQRKIDTETVEETICSLKASELQATNTLESVRQELADTEARLASAEEEREAISKTLSETESHRDAQSSEVSSLQECIRSLESELEGLQHQRKIDTETVEETICSLKASELQATNTLESVRQELADTEARLVSAEEEREAIGKALSETESHRDAQSSEVLSLHERIQSLESELEGLQHQHKIDTETLEETIRSLKASELQATNTLESVCQELADTEERLRLETEKTKQFCVLLKQTEFSLAELTNEKANLSEKINTYELSMVDLESKLCAETQRLIDSAQQVKSLESQVCLLESQLCGQVKVIAEVSAKETQDLKSQVALLSESSRSALAEVAALCQQQAADRESHVNVVSKKDEVILALKSKLGEMMVAYKRLKGHLKELQERATQQTTANNTLKTLYDEVNAQHDISVMELEASKRELALSREKLSELADKLRHTESHIEALNGQVGAYEDQRCHIQRQHDAALREQKEVLQAAATARDESARLRVLKLEKALTALTEDVEKKDIEVQNAVGRFRHEESKLAKATSDNEETDRKIEAERVELKAQLSAAHKTIAMLQAAKDANTDSQREAIVQYENQVVKLELQLQVETEGAKAARAALETYKKRAHTALKKTSSGNKLKLAEAAQSCIKLKQELASARSRISILDAQLQEARQHIVEVEKFADMRTQSAREALEAETLNTEISLRLEIDSLRKEVTRLEKALEDDRIAFEARIQQRTEQNEVLRHEVAALKEEVLTSTAQAHQAKNDEISDLSKQLQAALAAAASLAANDAGNCPYSPPVSPVEKERRSTASSSRSFDSDGNSSLMHQTTIEEQHEHITAAVADSCPIPLASKLVSSNDVEQQTKSCANEDYVSRLKTQIRELETTSLRYQKKFESTNSQLKEINRQQHEFGEHSMQAISNEYLKNVIMKYIESQVSSEKERLVPVIATLLNLSPREQEKLVAAHRPTDEGVGLFGGVFSLFGGGVATTSPPKPLAAPYNFKPSPTVKGNTTGAALGSKDKNGVLSFGSDEEDFVTPLNPFTA